MPTRRRPTTPATSRRDPHHSRPSQSLASFCTPYEPSLSLPVPHARPCVQSVPAPFGLSPLPCTFSRESMSLSSKTATCAPRERSARRACFLKVCSRSV